MSTLERQVPSSLGDSLSSSVNFCTISPTSLTFTKSSMHWLLKKELATDRKGTPAVLLSRERLKCKYSQKIYRKLHNQNREHKYSHLGWKLYLHTFYLLGKKKHSPHKFCPPSLDKIIILPGKKSLESSSTRETCSKILGSGNG